LPQRIADLTLFCDDVVYIEGGRPVYFGVHREPANGFFLSLDVGGAEAGHLHPISRDLPGPRLEQRREAARRSFVYGTESIGCAVDVLRRRGFSVTFASRVEANTQLESARDACEICADALVRRAVTAMDATSFNEIGTGLQVELKAASLLRKRLPPLLCREALRVIANSSRADDCFGRFGVEFEWVAETLIRLDTLQTPALFADLDDQVLFAIPNSAAQAEHAVYGPTASD
jgi:hypothetical protein